MVYLMLEFRELVQGHTLNDAWSMSLNRFSNLQDSDCTGLQCAVSMVSKVSSYLTYLLK